jgi:catalase
MARGTVSDSIQQRLRLYLLNIDPELAQAVAEGLGLTELLLPAKAARPTRDDLPVSDALSIIKHGPQTFVGRKLGILLTDGADAGLFNALTKAATKAGAVVEIVAPRVAGAVPSDGALVPVKQKIDGGPSVLFDAFAVLTSAEGAAFLAQNAAAKDFVNDAFAHCKFIGYCAEAMPLFEKIGLAADLDEGCVLLSKLFGREDLHRNPRTASVLATRIEGRPRCKSLGFGTHD